MWPAYSKIYQIINIFTMMFVYHYVIIPFQPQYLPRHASSGRRDPRRRDRCPKTYPFPLLLINSWFSYRICILIGSTTLSSLMCNRLCVVELWRHNGHVIFSTRPIQSDGLLIQHVLLLRSSLNFTSRYALEKEVNWQSLKMTSSLLTEL